MSDKKVKVLIVEDNQIIAEDLAAHIRDYGYFAMETVDCAEDALVAIKNELPDLLLLDVGLEGEIDGIQLANIIREKYNIPFIFLTAFYDDKTIERIKTTRPDAYLVKPIDDHSLKTTIEVVLYNFANRNSGENNFANKSVEPKFESDNHFFIKVKQGLQKINYSDVMYFEAYDNYSFVITSENKHIISLTLKALEEKLPSHPFVRAHRSFIVNIEKVERIEEDNLIIGKKSIPIGKTYRQIFMKFINLL